MQVKSLVVGSLAIAALVAGGSVTGPVRADAVSLAAVPGSVAGSVSVGAPPAGSGGSADCGRVRPSRHSQRLDGFILKWVPPGIGPLVTDFAYEWDDVRFRSRVWESGPYPDESYRVDLQVTVMRSPTFTDLSALRGFLAEYLERDPADWVTEPFDHPEGPGLSSADERFWLARPGVAVRVWSSGAQVDPRDLTRTACAVRRAFFVFPPGPAPAVAGAARSHGAPG